MPPIVKRIHGVVSRDGQITLPIGEHDMLALPRDVKPELLQHSHGIQVVDARELRYELRDVNFTHVGIAQQLIAYGQIVYDGLTNIRERLSFRGALRPATGQAGHGHRHAFFRMRQRDLVPHLTSRFPVRAELANLRQQLENGRLARAGHPGDRANRIAFDQSAKDRGAR